MTDNGSLPNSPNTAKFGVCFLTPNNLLRNYICKLSISLWLKIPNTSAPYNNIGTTIESKSDNVVFTSMFTLSSNESKEL